MKLLALTFVVFCWTVSRASTPCPRSLSKLLKDPIQFSNGSVFDGDFEYPSSYHWTEEKLTYGCICELATCVRRCCPNGGGLNRSACIDLESMNGTALRPSDEELAPELRWISSIEDAFHTVDNMICPENFVRFFLEPRKFDEERFVLQSDGTIIVNSQIMNQSDYCLAYSFGLEETGVVVCATSGENFEAVNHLVKYPVGIAVSIPFLFITLFIYIVLPELRNIHGMIMTCHIGSLTFAYVWLFIVQLDQAGKIPAYACKLSAFIIHFSFLASFFWLNVMCFDIWWTFGGFRSLQGSVKQRERKKFIMYSIYAWGCSTILTVVCIIMDFVPSVPKHYIRPEFGVESCWFTTDAAKAIYFYGPMGVTVFCNICLFISTAIKISRHKKDTAHQLKTSESRRHDDNKQWFNLYLKLFIVMGINWAMEIVSWLCKDSPRYVWYLTDLTNSLQGLIIFVIFVWKDKIKRLLLKRFGCHDRNVLSRNSTRSAFTSTTSRTAPTTIPLQDKSSVTDLYKNKASTDESDCA